MSTMTSAAQTVPLNQARSELESLLDQVRSSDTRIEIEQDGATVAVLVSAEAFARFEDWHNRQRLRQIMEEMSAPFEDVPEEELEREVSKIVAEVKAEMRAERAAAKSQP